MTAGLPGVGLSGLFALLTGLFMPIVALWRRMYGARRAVGYKYGLCFVLAVITAACAIALWDGAGTVIHFVSGRAQDAFRTFGIPTMVISVILLGVILLIAEGMLYAMGTAFETGRPKTSPTGRSVEGQPSELIDD